MFQIKNNGSLEFSTAKKTKQIKDYVWILWSSWIVICLGWRSETVIRNLLWLCFFPFIITLLSSDVVPKAVFVINLHDACFFNKIYGVQDKKQKQDLQHVRRNKQMSKI